MAEDVLDGTIKPVLPKVKEREEEDTNEPAVLKKRKRDSNLVNELLSNTAAVKVEVSAAAPFDPEALVDKPSKAGAESRTSMLHISRTTSFGPTGLAGKPREDSTSSKGTTSNGATTSSGLPETVRSGGDTSSGGSGPVLRIFEGLRFSHVIASETRGLEEALKRYGGTVVSEEERLEGEHVDYVIVRL